MEYSRLQRGGNTERAYGGITIDKALLRKQAKLSEHNNSSQGKPFTRNRMDSYLLNYSGDIIMAHLRGMG